MEYEKILKLCNESLEWLEGYKNPKKIKAKDEMPVDKIVVYEPIVIQDETKYKNSDTVVYEDIETPDIEKSEYINEENETKNNDTVVCEDTETPDIKVPNIKTPNIKTPNIKTPDIKTPNIKKPEHNEEKKEMNFSDMFREIVGNEPEMPIYVIDEKKKKEDQFNNIFRELIRGKSPEIPNVFFEEERMAILIINQNGKYMDKVPEKFLNIDIICNLVQKDHSLFEKVPKKYRKDGKLLNYYIDYYMFSLISEKESKNVKDSITRMDVTSEIDAFNKYFDFKKEDKRYSTLSRNILHNTYNYYNLTITLKEFLNNIFIYATNYFI
jgi:hypothetical protein